MICVYDSKTTDFSNNGITILAPILCDVIEERNGLYQLELEHPFDDRGKWQYLAEDNIIKAPTPQGDQLFRIFRKVKGMSSVTVNARHIFYDLINNMVEDTRPTNATGQEALTAILGGTQYAHRFIGESDIVVRNTKYYVRRNPIDCIMGEDGLLIRWGGELGRDNFLIKLLQNRGQDRGVTIRYGKNLIAIEEDLNLDTVITRIMPQGYDGLFLPEKYVDSPLINSYPSPKIRKIEFTDIKIDKENGISEAIAQQQLRQAAQNMFTVDHVDLPQANYKVDFIELSKTEEYKNYAVLEKVCLCDTVTIKHTKYGFDLKAKVIRYKFDGLTKKYKEIELGSFKANIGNTLNALSSIKNTIDDILNDYTTGSKMQQAIDHATNLLTGALGGNVVFRPKDKPVEILIMDTDDVMTAQKVWRWNLNGLGYSKTGINGTYDTAITQDGKIVATFITTGYLLADRIRGGTLTLGGGSNGNGIVNLLNGSGVLTGVFDKDGIKVLDGKLVIAADITNAGYSTPGNAKNIVSASNISFTALDPYINRDTSYAHNGFSVKSYKNGLGSEFSILGDDNQNCIFAHKGLLTLAGGNVAISGGKLLTSACKAYNSSPQSIAANSHVFINLNAENYNTENMHSNITNNSRITCKTAGFYMIIADITWYSALTGIRYAAIKLNGTTNLAAHEVNAVSVAGENNAYQVACVTYLNVNDYVQVDVAQTHSTAVSVNASLSVVCLGGM